MSEIDSPPFNVPPPSTGFNLFTPLHQHLAQWFRTHGINASDQDVLQGFVNGIIGTLLAADDVASRSPLTLYEAMMSYALNESVCGMSANVDDDNDFETIDAPVLCATCQQPLPLSVSPVAPALDLTDPVIAVVSSPDVLWALTEHNKALLKGRMSAQQRQSLSVYQQAAINVNNYQVPVIDSLLPYSPPLVYTFEGPDGKMHVHHKAAADDCWYVVQYGRDFTGILRLHTEYKLRVPSISRASGETVSNRQKAEYTWLTHYYRNDFGLV